MHSFFPRSAGQSKSPSICDSSSEAEHLFPKQEVGISKFLYRSYSPKTNTTMTEVIILRNGKIVYHSIEPRKMTETQIKQDFENYGVKTDGCTVLIQYS